MQISLYVDYDLYLQNSNWAHYCIYRWHYSTECWFMVRRTSFNELRHGLQQKQKYFLRFPYTTKIYCLHKAFPFSSTSPVGRGIITYMFVKAQWFTTLASSEKWVNSIKLTYVNFIHSFCPNYKSFHHSYRTYSVHLMKLH